VDLRTKLLAAIPAIAFVFDLVFYHRQRAIYDRFYLWWFRLSELNIPGVVKNAINLSLTIDRTICGPRLTSARSWGVAALITVVTTSCVALFAIPKDAGSIAIKLGATALICLFNLPVGLLGFLITRSLLKALRLADSLSLSIALSVVTLMAIEVIVLAFWFLTGALAATFLKIEFTHGISVNGAVSTFGFLIIFAYAYTHGLIHVALVSTYAFFAFTAALLVIHITGRICFLVQRFLEWQIEKPKFAALTAISTALALALQLIFLVFDSFPAKTLGNTLSSIRRTAAQHSTNHGITSTWKLMLAESGNERLKIYVRQVADGLVAYGNRLTEQNEDFTKLSNQLIDRVFAYLKRPAGTQSDNITSSPTPH
jgi:hypothetical protein